MSIEIKAQNIVKQFAHIKDWEQKYEKIIQLGKEWPGLSDEFKTDDLKIKGCQSQVWIKAELIDGRVKIQGDSDAVIVKGLVALTVSVFNDNTPEEIMRFEPLFLNEIGLNSGLSPSRTNGLFSMIKQIKYYATAFNYLLSKK